MAITLDDLVIDAAPEFTDIREDGEASERPRRGRPPGVKNGEGRARRSTGENKTVSEALGAMQSAYDLIGLLLKPLAPNAARVFTDGISRAQESNKRAFEASPRLAKRIATTGEKGGTAGFIIGNAVLIAPVVAIAAGEVQMKMPAKGPKPPKPQAPQPQSGRRAATQDIPRAQPLIPTGEGFEVPRAPIWDANKQAYVSV